MSYLNIFIAVLLTIAFSLNVNATVNTTTLSIATPATVEKVEGGPRTIIQNMTDVVVIQPTGTNLYITIVNSEGTSVIEVETHNENTVISTEELEGGVYTIGTIDDNGDYQEFFITIK
jgi:hypothetical protein